MRHLFIFVGLALTFVGVSALAETGQEYYEKGYEAYKKNQFKIALEYFEKACRGGYSDGCVRRSAMEKIIAANPIADYSSNSNSMSSLEIGEEFYSKGVDEYNNHQYAKALEYFEQSCRAGFGAGCTRKREMEKIEVYKNNNPADIIQNYCSISQELPSNSQLDELAKLNNMLELSYLLSGLYMSRRNILEHMEKGKNYSTTRKILEGIASAFDPLGSPWENEYDTLKNQHNKILGKIQREYNISIPTSCYFK